MRFPLRLTAELAKIQFARAIGGSPYHPLILNAGSDSKFYSAIGFDPGVDASPAKVQKKRNAVIQRHNSSPIVWIGGEEPLANAEIARIANTLAEAGRYVFLQTDGLLLRRRIHEFRPSSRLYLTIRFDGDELSHDRRNGRSGCYRLAVEGIRTARLSGFMICAHVVLHPDTTQAELENLQVEVRKMGVDGMVMTRSQLTRDLERMMAEARRRFLVGRWGKLSRLFDEGGVSPVRERVAESKRTRFEEEAEA
jgi:hypothetical protein